MIEAARAGLTREALAADLARLGVRAGSTLLLHSSLRAVGWLSEGPATLVRALLDVLGRDGTLVVPAQTTSNRDPSTWSPPSPPSRWDDERDGIAGFDPSVTPSEGVGVVAETVRTWSGACRSAHPQTSFAAVGARARHLMDGHAVDCHLGERSPLARIEQDGGDVLLLGVGYARTTAFHLAEYRQPSPPTRSYGCAVATPTGRQWITYSDLVLDDGDFSDLGSAFEEGCADVRAGRVGGADSRLFPLRSAVAFAEVWMKGRAP